MDKKIYKKPVLNSYLGEDILELIGAGHNQSSQITVDVWRGARLDTQRPAEHRIAKGYNPNYIIQKRKDIC